MSFRGTKPIAPYKNVEHHEIDLRKPSEKHVTQDWHSANRGSGTNRKKNRCLQNCDVQSSIVDVNEVDDKGCKKCVCNRAPKNYRCRGCYNMVKNVRLSERCPVHPMVIMLMDLDTCPGCGRAKTWLREINIA